MFFTLLIFEMLRFLPFLNIDIDDVVGYMLTDMRNASVRDDVWCHMINEFCKVFG